MGVVLGVTYVIRGVVIKFFLALLKQSWKTWNLCNPMIGSRDSVSCLRHIVMPVFCLVSVRTARKC